MKKKRFIQQKARPRRFAHLLLLTTGGAHLLPQFAEAAYAPQSASTPDTSPIIGFKADKKQQASRYYKVKRGDTLERIARHVDAKGLHRSQIIVALFQTNPHAFSKNNLHKLKLGAKLRAPSYQIAAQFSAKEAQAIILAHAAPNKPQSKRWLKHLSQPGNVIHKETEQKINEDAKKKVDHLKQKLSAIEKKLQTQNQTYEQQQTLLSSAITPIEVAYSDAINRLNQKLTQEKTQFSDKKARIQKNNQNLQQNRTALITEKQRLLQSQNTLQPQVQQALFVTPRHYQDLIEEDNQTFFRRTILKTRLQSPYSPLLAKAEALYCAATSEQAKPLLSSLLTDAEPGTTWPDEWLGSTNKPELYAGTLDILLATLERTSVRFPALREDVERIALQWNYCDVLEGKQFYNIKMREERAERLLTDSLPLNGHGFQRWGFMLNDPVDRFIPRLLSEIRLAPWAYQYFLHRAYRKQCFPHPVTGQRYPEEDRERKASQRSVFQSLLTEKRDINYPYDWFPHCEVPTVIAPIKPTWSQGLLRRISDTTVRVENNTKVIEQNIAKLEETSQQLKQQIAEVTRTIEKKINQQKHEKTEKVQIIKTKLKTIMAKMEEKRQQADREKQRLQAQVITVHQQQKQEQERAKQLARQQRIAEEIERRKLAKLAADKAMEAAEQRRLAKLAADKAIEAAEQRRLAKLAADKAAEEALAKAEAEKKRANQPGENDIVMPVSRSGDTSIYWEDPKKAKQKAQTKDNTDNKTKNSYKLKLSGSVSHNSSLATGNHTLGGSVNWSPYKNWFVNASGSYQYGPNNPNGFTYAWNAGYSDWRPGTMSFRLDNWGPLKPGDGLALEKAVFGASYKFDSDILRKYNLGGGLSYSYPLSGNSSGSVGMSMQYNLTKEWYFRTGVSQSIDGGDPTWTYGFGKYNWRPNKWRFEYSNYGKNEYPLANLNKGSISINRGWQKEWDIPIPSVVRKVKLPSPAQQVADVVLAPPFAQPNKLPAPVQNLLEKGIDRLGSTVVKSTARLTQQTIGQDIADGKFAQQAKSIATQTLSTVQTIQAIKKVPSQTLSHVQSVQSVQTTTTQPRSTQVIGQQATRFQAHAQLGGSPRKTAKQATHTLKKQTPSSLKLTIPTSFRLHHQQTSTANDPRRLTF